MRLDGSLSYCYFVIHLHAQQADFHIPKSYIIPFLLCMCVFVALFCRQVPFAFNGRFYPRKRVVSLRSLSSTFTVSGVKITWPQD